MTAPPSGAAGRRLTAEQAEAVALRDGPLLLAANAGSGKTTVLVERFVRSVLEDGLAPSSILAITFTDKAAGELRSRIRRRFAELGEEAHARDVAGAWVSTIHGFCQRVLRAHAVAAGLDPAFTVLDAAEQRALRAGAFDDALGTWLGDRADALDLAAAYGVDRLRRMVEVAHDELRSRGLPLRLGRPPEADPRAAHAALLRAARVLEDELVGAKSGKAVDAARQALADCGTLRFGGHAPKVGRQANALKTPAADAYREACATYHQALADDQAAAALPLVEELLQAFGSAYAARRTRRAALDFADLELRARDLLRDVPAIAHGYATRFARVMVDEFQDTNPLQLEIVRAVAPEHRFVVGDELQSIYGFRNADVEVFRGERARLRSRDRVRELRTNFRSRPELLGTLDAAFAAGHGPGAVPFSAGRQDPPAGAPVVELLLTDEPAWKALDDAEDPLAARVAAGLPSAPPATLAEARAVARRIGELVRSGAHRAGDIVVLLRAVANMALFERALQLEGLATLPSAGRGWWGRQEVLDLTSWLGAVANPRDEPALLGALASPVGGVSSDGLALLALARRRWGGGARLWDVVTAAAAAGAPATDGAAGGAGVSGTIAAAAAAGAASPSRGAPPADAAGLLAALPPADLAAVGAFAGALRRARDGAPRLPLAALLHDVVEATGYDGHLLAQPGGRRRLANVHKLVRLAAAYEARRGRDLRGFIDHARAELDAEALETDAPVDLAGEDAVRLMTIHAAKGLEFPVVVVPDLGRQPPNGAPDLLVDPAGVAGLRLRTVAGENLKSSTFEAERARRGAAEREEARRVLHVAFTRAEELLVLSGAGALDRLPAPEAPKAPPLSWVARELVGDPATADGEVPAGGSGPPVRVVRNTPDRAAGVLGLATEAGEQLGLLLAVDEAAGRREAGGPRGRRSSSPDGQPSPAATRGGPAPAGLGVALPGERPAAAAAAAAAPPPPAHLSYSSLTDYAQCAYRFYLKRLAGLPSVEPPAHLRRAPEPGRLEGRVRGTLVHALLEHADLRPGAPAPSAEAVRALADELDEPADDAAVADVLRLARAALAAPIADRLRAASRLHRERAFTFPLDEVLLTGYVDVLAFEADGTALVVDWKTDRVEPGDDPAALAERGYGTQRAVYALAALRAGAPAVEVVHLFLERADRPAAVRFTAADAPALAARLREAAGGVLGGRYAPTTEPHAGICATCPGRGGLCSRPLELTDRVLE